jgi:hypothetical protein
MDAALKDSEPSSENEARPTRKAAVAVRQLFKQVAISEGTENSTDDWESHIGSDVEIEEAGNDEMKEEYEELSSESDVTKDPAVHPHAVRQHPNAKPAKTARVEPDESEIEDSDDGKSNKLPCHSP